MKKKLKTFLLTFVLVLSSVSLFAQSYNVSGSVKSLKTGEFLSDAIISLFPADLTTTSGSFGEFIFKKVPSGKYTLKVNLIGYEPYTEEINVNQNTSLNINLVSLGFTTEVIEVNRAIERETPVSFTNIDSKTIESKRHGQDAPLLIKNVPGFYAYSTDGVGNGEGRLLIRGFSQNYVQVLINGIPTNDPESNAVYWSNWGSVSSNAGSVQIQRGAGSSLYGSGSFGGSFNILTATDINRFYGLNLILGSPKNSLYGISFKTGLIGKFAGTLNIDRKIAEGSRISGRYEGINYYTSINFYPSSHQSFNLVLHGAPQEHGYSYSNHIIYFNKFGYTANSAPLLPISVLKYLPNNATTGAPNYGINSDSRVLKDDKYVNLSHNFYHKPQLELHYNHTFADNSYLKATFFFSIGRGGGSSINGAGTMFSISKNSNFIGYSIDTLKTNLLNNEGVISDSASAMNYLKNAFQRISYSLHQQFGILASYQKDFSKNLSITGGIELRKWTADHPGHYTNLFGKTNITQTYGYRKPDNTIGTFARKVYQGDLDGPESDLGNIFGWNLAGSKDPTYKTQYRNYLGETPQFTIFAQSNYEFEKIGLNLMGSLQYVWYQYKLTENMPSENAIGRQLDSLTAINLGLLTAANEGPRGDKFYMTDGNKWYEFNLFRGDRTRGFFQPKFGFNWNATKNINIFANFAHVERMIDLGVYYDQGNVNPSVEDEKSNQFELGIGWTSNFVQLKLNGYYMLWDNKSARISDISMAGQPGYDRNGFRSELIGTSEHKGIEFEAGISFDSWLPFKGLTFKGSFTYMDNVWKTVLDNVKKDRNGNRRAFNSNALDANGKSYTLYFDELEGKPVASGPQLMTSASLQYNYKGFFCSFDMNFFGRDIMLDGGTYLPVKSEFYGTSASNKELYKTEYDTELPTRFIFDFNAGYNFKFEKIVQGTISFQILNLFDTKYFSSSDRFGLIPGYLRTFRANLSLGY
ncbi:MAG: TonB-dependent receptor [Ignavibacteria bacterium]|nr:TonB-dependent receptor [Ignavibacteria bacterium]